MIDYKYLAGWTDADGSITITRQYRNQARLGFSLNVRVRFSNTSRKTIREIKNFLTKKDFTTSKTHSTTRPSEKDCWNIVLTRQKDMLRFLKIIEPLLITKRKQAQLSIKFLESRKRNRHHTSIEIALFKQVAKLNRRGR